MSRRQRRAAVKAPIHHQPALEVPKPLVDDEQPAKPGILVRIFAKMVLAPWVLKRVHHADVERLLASVAIQAGRPEVAMNLLSRITMRESK